MEILLEPIAYVRNVRKEMEDDNWGEVVSRIELAAGIIPDALNGIEAFSHLNIIFFMDKVDDGKARPQYRHPRNDESLPKVGTYAQRNKNRPNKLGLTIVELIERKGNVLIVRNLDAFYGTPVLDIKPVMNEFLPQGEVIQADWTHDKELLEKYLDERLFHSV